MPLPSSATLSRFAFVLDMTWMLRMRAHWTEVMQDESLPSVHVLVDSSPKAGVDWENTEMWYCQGRDLTM